MIRNEQSRRRKLEEFSKQTLVDSDGPRRSLHVGPEMSPLALEIAGRTLFSRDVSEEADAVGSAFGIVGRYLEGRFNNARLSLPL